MSQVAENVIPGLEVIEHFGDAQAVIRRIKGEATIEEMACERARCLAAVDLFAGGNEPKSRRYLEAAFALDDAIQADAERWSRARTLRFLALSLVAAADAF